MIVLGTSRRSNASPEPVAVGRGRTERWPVPIANDPKRICRRFRAMERSPAPRAIKRTVVAGMNDLIVRVLGFVLLVRLSLGGLVLGQTARRRFPKSYATVNRTIQGMELLFLRAYRFGDVVLRR